MKKIVLAFLFTTMLLSLSGCNVLSNMYCGEPKYANLDQNKIGQDALDFVKAYAPEPLKIRSVHYQGACNAGGDYGDEPYQVILEKENDPNISIAVDYYPITNDFFVSAFDAARADYFNHLTDDVPNYSTDFYGKMYANQLKGIFEENKLNVTSIDTTVSSVADLTDSKHFIRTLKVYSFVQIDENYSEEWVKQAVLALTKPEQRCFATNYCGAFATNDYSDMLLSFKDKTISLRGLLIEHPEWPAML